MRPAVDSSVSSWLQDQSEAAFGTTGVTVMEIAFDLARLPLGKRRSDLEERFSELLHGGEGLVVLALDTDAASIAGQLRARREELGLASSQADMMIAGICIQNEASLATRNTSDFDHLGLELINPYPPER